MKLKKLFVKETSRYKLRVVFMVGRESRVPSERSRFPRSYLSLKDAVRQRRQQRRGSAFDFIQNAPLLCIFYDASSRRVVNVGPQKKHAVTLISVSAISDWLGNSAWMEASE